MLSPPPPKVRCREISAPDIGDVIELLTRGYHAMGFPASIRHYWAHGLERLSEYAPPEGFPKYGYVLESSNKIVGAVLTIFSKVPAGNERVTRCNIAGIYVDPAFKTFAALLHAHAIRRKDVTYLNLPGPLVRPLVEAQGFKRYSNGQFVALPLLNLKSSAPQARVVAADAKLDVPVDPIERDLLLEHARYGCISLWCTTATEAVPFVFLRLKVQGIVPGARLVYCRSVEDFVRFARPIGRYLALRGSPVVIIDSNGPIPGLVGRYFEGRRPKYFKGPVRPRLGDLAYTHLSIFEDRNSIG
jgi:hypothetical protein